MADPRELQRDPFALTGRRILVTGASSGLGRATALRLAAQGARTVLVGRNFENLEATREQMGDPTAHVTAPFDLAEFDGIPAWVQALAREHGSLDGIVHAAGIQTVLPLRAYTREKMESAYAINVHAGAMLAKGLRQKGVAAETASLVLLASVAAFTGDSALGIYSGTKGALVAMCRSLAVELAAQGIRVNCLAPGLVRTEMAEALSERTGADQYAAIEALHPLGLGNPDDVACAVTYLLSPAARWITGTTLVIDGGYTAR